jgi:hypothetical protein
MAGIALRRQGTELANGRALVAGIAIERGMGSHQGKAAVLLLNLLE